MGLNIGNDGVQAARALKGHPEWEKLCAAMMEQSRHWANQALDAPHELQASACGYARALRDVWIAFHSATMNVSQNQVKKPGVTEAR